MKVHIIKPYDLDKDLGLAYNEEMSRIPDGDWGCMMDYDTMLLTTDCGKILHGYAERFPDVGLLTCFTNRLHKSAVDQLFNGIVSENTCMDYHMKIAYNQRKLLFSATEIPHEISGMLMMVSKKTWLQIKFTEGGKCLSVDNQYCWKLLSDGKKILRMDGLYILHLYRLLNGVTDKTHLL